jgi:hypothetical protein
MVWSVFAWRCIAGANVRACGVCRASGNEHGSLSRDCVHEHVVHERSLHDCGDDDCRCDCANVYEPPLDVSEGVRVFQYL